MAFEEWESFVKYSIVHHHQEAVQMLETIAIQHHDDGWRFNAIRLLSESDVLTENLKDRIKERERDHEIIELINSISKK